MATLIKYKDQVTVNLDNVSIIKIDEMGTETPEGLMFALRFHTNDGFERSWNFFSREEAQGIEVKMVQMSGGILEL